MLSRPRTPLEGLSQMLPAVGFSSWIEDFARAGAARSHQCGIALQKTKQLFESSLGLKAHFPACAPGPWSGFDYQASMQPSVRLELHQPLSSPSSETGSFIMVESGPPGCTSAYYDSNGCTRTDHANQQAVCNCNQQAVAFISNGEEFFDICLHKDPTHEHPFTVMQHPYAQQVVQCDCLFDLIVQEERERMMKNQEVSRLDAKPSSDSNTEPVPPPPPQRVLVLWPRPCTTPNLGNDVHSKPYAGLVRARQCRSVAQSICGSPLAPCTFTSSTGAAEHKDDYLTLKEDRDNLANKLLITNALLAKEQCLRRAAESDVASQRKLVDQLVSAQEGSLQQTIDLDAVPLGTLCSAVGHRLVSKAQDGLQHVVDTSVVLAAHAKAAVQSGIQQQHNHRLSTDISTGRDPVNVVNGVTSEHGTIHWQSSLSTIAVQSLVWYLQALTSCWLLTKTAVCRTWRAVSTGTKWFARQMILCLNMSSAELFLFGKAVCAVCFLIGLSTAVTLVPAAYKPRTAVNNHNFGNVTLQSANQLHSLHSDKMLARCSAQNNDMTASLPYVNTVASINPYILYLGEAEVTVGFNSTVQRNHHNTVVQAHPNPDNATDICVAQDVENVVVPAAGQLSRAGGMFDGMKPQAANPAAAVTSPTSGIDSDATAQTAEKATLLALAPPENGISYERLVATFAEQQRKLKMFDSLPKLPSAAPLMALPHHCAVTAGKHEKAALLKHELVIGQLVKVSTSNMQSLLSPTLGKAKPLLETAPAALLPALKAPSNTCPAALLAHQSPPVGLRSHDRNTSVSSTMRASMAVPAVFISLAL